MKRYLLLVMAMMAMVVCAQAQTQTNGTCGDKVTWSYDESSGTLTLSGSGAMYDYENFNISSNDFSKAAPWMENYWGYIHSVVVDEGVTTIGKYAFSYCTNLVSVSLPSSLTSIGDYAFSPCSKLPTINFPDGIKSIGEFAFNDCDALTTLVLTASLESLGEFAFYSCNNLTTVELPASLKNIGDYVFQECYKISDVTVHWTSLEGVSMGDKIFNGHSNLGSVKLHIPLGTKSIYENADPWKNLHIVEAYAMPSMDPSKYFAVLSAEKDTLTLYYSENDAIAGGVNDWSIYGSEQGGHVKTFVFDDSFRAATPLTTKGWFKHFDELTQIVGLTNLNTAEVTDMSEMFYGIATPVLDLTGFDFSKVTSTSRMFADNPYLCRIACTADLGNAAALKESSDMFDGCLSLRGGKGTSWQHARRDSTMAHVDSIGRYGYFAADATDYEPEVLSEEGLYGVLSADGRTMTLYFDDQIETRQGISDWAHRRYPEVRRIALDASVSEARPTTLNRWFVGFPNMQTIDLTGLDLSDVRDARGMFCGAKDLRHIYSESDWSEYPNIVSSGRMFYECISLLGGDSTRFDRAHTDSAYAHLDSKDRPGYFSKRPAVISPTMGPNDEIYLVAGAIDEPSILYCDDQREARGGMADWNSGRLYYYSKKIVLDPSMAKARPTNLNGWFNYFTNLETIEGLEYLNTSEVTDMRKLFYGCYALKALDLNSFDMSKVTDITEMFGVCSKLERIYCDQDWSAIPGEKVFLYCDKLKGNVSNAEYNDANKGSAFAKVEGGYFSRNVESPILYGDMDADGKTLTLRVDKGIHAYLKEEFIDRKGFNKDAVEEIIIDPSAEEIAAETPSLFSNFPSLRYISGLHHLNISSSENMNSMFEGCKNLQYLDLSYFNTERMKDAYSMFRSCSSLKTIYCNEDWSQRVTSDNMFLACEQLVGGNGTTYAEEHTDIAYARPDGAEPGYFTSTLMPYHVVTFVDYDDTVIKEEVVEQGGSATAPEDPERIGYQFLGWDPEDFSNVQSDMLISPWYKKMTVYHTVTFVDYDDTVLDKQKVEDGHDAVAPDDPVRPGYIFTGWDEDFTNVKKDLTVTAQYKKDQGLEGVQSTENPP